ncbi:unnamed protein product [Echinostoma caproni]|uniref:Uncharacterized protein n=1 Tax=Echinostoma caproni TaxID=27848 RepID=A0A183AF83_9TREM|nr:unnamed protein product [Echinostoma caproni]
MYDHFYVSGSSRDPLRSADHNDVECASLLGFKPSGSQLQARVEPSLMYDFPLPIGGSPGTASTSAGPGLNTTSTAAASSPSQPLITGSDGEPTPLGTTVGGKLDKLIMPNATTIGVRSKTNALMEQKNNSKTISNYEATVDGVAINRKLSLLPTQPKGNKALKVTATIDKPPLTSVVNLGKDGGMDLDSWQMGPPESASGVPQYEEFLAIQNSFAITPPRLSIGSVERVDGRPKSRSHSPD